MVINKTIWYFTLHIIKDLNQGVLPLLLEQHFIGPIIQHIYHYSFINNNTHAPQPYLDMIQSDMIDQTYQYEHNIRLICLIDHTKLYHARHD